jgi:uncharacterized protein (DUF2147 family)
MRKFFILAALLATGATAEAGAIKETINFGGRTIQIEIPKKCRDISCISLSLPGKVSNDEAETTPAPTAAPAPAPAAQTQAATPAAPAPVAQPARSKAEFSGSAVPWNERQKIEAQPQQTVAPAPPPVPETRTAAVTAPAAPQAGTAGDTPLGVWQTEKKEGLVRIQDCGANLCGYSVEKDGSNGKQVLIDMKSGGASKWSGTIHDIRGGGKYSSTITLRNNTPLAVQGCAFGGMFCGGETWKRAQ